MMTNFQIVAIYA